MPTAIKGTTVAELIQELHNFPSDALISIKDSDANRFLIVGFQAGSDGVNMIIDDDESNEDDASDE
ncbi:MAG: hypothetical protein V7K38_26775 [Nostoc sp.]|uniref:hypothetical protein n=1 Tax=Nostoc sp. TaxID=1180 RepID=UPI002FF7B1F6